MSTLKQHWTVHIEEAKSEGAYWHDNDKAYWTLREAKAVASHMRQAGYTVTLEEHDTTIFDIFDSQNNKT